MAVWHQQQHIYIGVGEQFATTETADRQQGKVAGKPSALPERTQTRIGQS